MSSKGGRGAYLLVSVAVVVAEEGRRVRAAGRSIKSEHEGVTYLGRLAGASGFFNDDSRQTFEGQQGDDAIRWGVDDQILDEFQQSVWVYVRYERITPSLAICLRLEDGSSFPSNRRLRIDRFPGIVCAREAHPEGTVQPCPEETIFPIHVEDLSVRFFPSFHHTHVNAI